MYPKRYQLLALLFTLIFLWRAPSTAAYNGFCEEPNTFVYCNCNNRRDGETSVSCFITSVPKVDDEVWRHLAEVENVVSLDLLPMLPAKLDYVPNIRGLRELKTLTIQQSQLGDLPKGSIQGFKQLKDLKLESCEITSLQKGAFSDLPSLKKLSLSENSMQELLSESFDGLTELESLFLERNNISRIEMCAFCDLQNLRELDLFNNKITDLTDYTFRGLRYLRRLYLYSNQIRILNDRVFHAMPKLVELDLSSNRINHVAPRAFQGLEKLQLLKMNYNEIKMLPGIVFKPLINVRTLDLSDNQLETLQTEVMENMTNAKEQLISLAFKENPLQCDCRLKWVKTYLSVSTSHQLMRELREVQCRSHNEDFTNFTLYTVHTTNLECDGPRRSGKNKDMSSALRSVTESVDIFPYQVKSNSSNPPQSKGLQDGVEMESRSSNSRTVLLSSYLIVIWMMMWTIVSSGRR